MEVAGSSPVSCSKTKTIIMEELLGFIAFASFIAIVAYWSNYHKNYYKLSVDGATGLAVLGLIFIALYIGLWVLYLTHFH